MSKDAYNQGWDDADQELPHKNPYNSEEENENYVDYNRGYNDQDIVNGKGIAG